MWGYLRPRRTGFFTAIAQSVRQGAPYDRSRLSPWLSKLPGAHGRR